MNARKLDRLFERFRRKGDVAALGEVFDEAAPELYRVAVHLARDLHRAEDLVQSTFVSAIEARDTYDSQRSLLPWLLGILTRKSAWERRKLSRTIDPDRLQPRLHDAPSVEAELNELSADVERAVERIPSPYREVLVLHLRHGESPQEIAHKLNRAPGTVRVQIHRGLEMLRRALPVGLAVGGSVSTIAPRGLAAVRASVLGSATASTSSLATAALVATSSNVIGGIVMSTKGWLVAAGVLCGLGWLALQAIRHVDSASHVIDSATAPGIREPATMPGSTRPDSRGDAPNSIPLERKPVDSTSVPAQLVATSVSGQFLLPDGSAAAGAFVALLSNVAHAPRALVIEGTTGADGGFNLRAEPGAYYVAGLAEGMLAITREVTLVERIELRLEPISFSNASHIHGHVWITGMPDLTGCTVSASLNSQGNVIDLNGRRFAWSEDRLYLQTGIATTDAAGRFAIEGLESAVHHVTVESASRVRILGPGWDVAATSNGVELGIDYARVVIHVECEDQPLDANVWISERTEGFRSAVPQTRATAMMAMMRKHSGSEFELGPGPTVEVLVPPDGGYLIRAEKDGYSSTGKYGVVAPAAGKTIERTIQLKRDELRTAELVISLATSDGSTIEDAGFALFQVDDGASQRIRIGRSAMFDLQLSRQGPDGRPPDLVRDVHQVNGAFHLKDLPPGRFQLRVQANGSWNDAKAYWFHDPIQVELRPDAIERTSVELFLGGRLRIQCKDSHGLPLAARCRLTAESGVNIPISFFTEVGGSIWIGGGSALNSSAPDGSNECAESLAPGKYDVRLSLDGYADATRAVTISAGKMEEVVFVLMEN